MTDLPVAPNDEEAITILVVDDQPENLLALEAVLEPLGHRILTAKSGRDALRLLLNHEVSVILLDVVMPVMDGFELAAAIKARPRARDIPMLFLTAQSTEPDQAQLGFSSGAVDFVTKPVEGWLLRAKVTVFVELHRKNLLLVRQSELLAQRLDRQELLEAEQLRTLADASLAINSTLALDAALQLVTDRARVLLRARHAETTMYPTDAAEHAFVATSHAEKYEAWHHESRPVDLTLMHSNVLAKGSAVRRSRHELTADPNTRRLGEVAPGHPLLEGWLAVPLRGRSGTSIGLIVVADKEDGELTANDESILTQLAQFAAIAIENAARFEQEHVIAEILQRAMLPDLLPDAPGLALAARYQPSNVGGEVGGDWYDVIALDDGRVGLVVGDIAGRGTRAAATMGQLRIGLRAYAMTLASPGAVLAALDRLFQGLPDASIATVIYLVLDPTTGEAVVSSAGHPPPVIAVPGCYPVLAEMAVGPPLGVQDDPCFPERQLRIEFGADLVFYTDGLVEDRRIAIDVGLNQLCDALASAPDDLEGRCDHVLELASAPDRHDDIALLIARLLPNA